MSSFFAAALSRTFVRPLTFKTVQRNTCFKPFILQKMSFSTSTLVLAKTEVDGIYLNWEKFGNGPHVLFCLPGLLGTIQGNFGPVIERMDLEKFTVVAWDPPGYGASRPPDRHLFTKDEIPLKVDAEYAAKLMMKLGYEKYSILGWSSGGGSAAIIAGIFPERVNKLVMCNTPTGYSENMRKGMKAMLTLENWPPAQQEAILKDYDRPYVDEVLKYWKAMNDNLGDHGYKKYFSNVVPNTRCPTLFIHGEKDTVAPRKDVEGYASWIPHMKFHVVPNGVHDHLSFVDELLTVTQDFLLSD